MRSLDQGMGVYKNSSLRMLWAILVDANLCGLCLPCLSLSRIHCQTFCERSVASRGRHGDDMPSSVALTGRLYKVLQRLKVQKSTS